jgi:hypothetical protein
MDSDMLGQCRNIPTMASAYPDFGMLMHTVLVVVMSSIGQAAESGSDAVS